MTGTPQTAADTGMALCDICAAEFRAGPITLARMDMGQALYCRRCAAGLTSGDPIVPDAETIDALLERAEAHQAAGRAHADNRRGLEATDEFARCRDTVRDIGQYREQATDEQWARVARIIFELPTHMAREFIP